MKDLEKMEKYLISDFTVMLIINIYFVINYFLEIVWLGTGKLSLIDAILSVLLLIAGIICAKKKKIACGIIGIVVGVCMIISGALLNIILGIFITIHSIIYLVNYNKRK